MIPIPNGKQLCRLSKKGEARISFYNNSRTTRIVVDAEGQAADGTLLWYK